MENKIQSYKGFDKDFRWIMNIILFVLRLNMLME